MKIGIVGPIWLNIPPAGYGGTERVVENLIAGLVKQNHDVTLFGPATAKVPCKLVPTVEKPLREMNVDWKNSAYTLYHITEAFDRASEFDIIHVHLNKNQDYVALPLALLGNTPTVFTLHFQIPTDDNHKDRFRVLNKYKEMPFTSISNSQRKQVSLNYIRTVYNSLNISEYQFCSTPEDYFVWLGRVNPTKGTHFAILAAKKAGVNLKMMGIVDPGDELAVAYYAKEVKPLIDGKQIIWLGEVNGAEKSKVLSKARGFLNPIQWEEPFGLVMIESQAVGTPVISFARGAANEIIADGKDGFLVSTLDEMVEKIKSIDTIKRIQCRSNVESRFSIETMTQGYIDSYYDTISDWKLFQENQMKELIINRI